RPIVNAFDERLDGTLELFAVRTGGHAQAGVPLRGQVPLHARRLARCGHGRRGGRTAVAVEFHGIAQTVLVGMLEENRDDIALAGRFPVLAAYADAADAAHAAC